MTEDPKKNPRAKKALKDIRTTHELYDLMEETEDEADKTEEPYPRLVYDATIGGARE